MDTSDILDDSITAFTINLESLLDLSSKLNEIDDENFILNSVLLSLMGKLKFVRACMLINHNDELLLSACKGKKPDFGELIIKDEKRDLDTFNLLFNLAGFKYIFQVRFKNQLLGLILLGNRLIPGELNTDELRYAELVSQITANAIQNARFLINIFQEKQKTEKRNQLLVTLFEVTRDFSNLLSRPQILKMLSYHLMGQLMVNRFALLIESSDLEFNLLVNRFEESKINDKLPLTHTNFFTTHIEDPDIPDEIREKFPEAEAVSPMIVQGKTKGLLIVGKSMSGIKFDDMNMHFISALGNTAMASIENERLFQEELKKIAIENELMYALEIQENLLPKNVPIINGFTLSGRSIPSRHVGGDYYDFIELSPTKYMFAIADVSGKGMPASLIMANVQAALRVLAPLNLDLVDLVEKLNHLIFHNTAADKFITFFLGLLDTENSTFSYINAGHNPPVLYRSISKELIPLESGGLILGCLEEPGEYLKDEITFEDNDALLMFTDGVTESLNENKEEYGEKRMFASFVENVEFAPEQIIDNMLSHVNRHFLNLFQYDDITIVVLKKAASGSGQVAAVR